MKISPEWREHLRKIGKKGGKATVKKHGKDHMVKIGKKGAATTNK
jgi:general stress protein YciG